MGYIYIIKNTVNEKVYIGQTIHTIARRWCGHTYLVGKSDKDLYRDMYLYGIDKFNISILEECENKKLNKKEIYWINKLDSFRNGYNNTIGGGSYIHGIDDYTLLNIIEDIDSYSIKDLTIKYNVSSTIIKQIRREYGFITDIYIKYTNEPKQVVCYDLNFDNGILYKSFRHITKILGMDHRNLYREVGIACQNGNIAYGHRWQLVSDLIYDNKIFRTKFDKEAYIQGNNAYQPEGKQYYIVDGALDFILKKKKNKYKKFKLVKCRVCGRRISERAQTGMCNSCANVAAKGKSPKPSKEELKVLLDKGLQKKQIAELHGRTDSTVHYWIHSYRLG